MGGDHRVGEFGGEDSGARRLLDVYSDLKRVAVTEYPEIVENARIERDPGDAPRNLRVFMHDGSFLDVLNLRCINRTTGTPIPYSRLCSIMSREREAKTADETAKVTGADATVLRRGMSAFRLFPPDDDE
jgi:hypothetical protein